MSWVWILMGLFVAACVLHVVSLRLVTRGDFDETHFIRLPNDRPLSLYRIRPRGDRRRRHPVICCHGLGACRFNLALPGPNSLAHRLAEDGYDVWVVDLSGFGRSVPLNWRVDGRYDVRFEDFVRRDAPAAIDRVMAETGAETVHWVGHSMGGMTAYGLCQTAYAEKIRDAVAVASPGTLKHHRYFRPLARLDFLISPLPKIDLGLGSRLLAPLLRWIPGHVHQAVLNFKNMDLQNARYVAANVISTCPVPLLRQFSAWIKGGNVTATDGYDFTAGLEKVTTPFLLMSCEADRLVPAPCVRDAFVALASADKRYVHLSKANGQADYGHGDVIFGETAPEHVFALVLNWINERD